VHPAAEFALGLGRRQRTPGLRDQRSVRRVERGVAMQAKCHRLQRIPLLRCRRAGFSQSLRCLGEDFRRMARRQLIDVCPPQRARHHGECHEARDYGEVDLEIKALH